MSDAQVPTSPIISKNQKMMECPATVQSLVPLVHPLEAGPALVSPDITTTKFAPTTSPSTTLSTASNQQQPTGVSSSNLSAHEGLIISGIQMLAPRTALQPKSKILKGPLPALPVIGSSPTTGQAGTRLNKFVRRLHDMLVAEKNSGIVEWRRGLMVLHSTGEFSKTILPKYFNTRNFKTFRRQLNYYGFVHVRSFSTTGSTTTALWVNRDLAKRGSDEISSVLMLKRVEPCESAKTAEGRRIRKEQAISTVEDDIGVSPKTLQMEQIRAFASRAGEYDSTKDASLLLQPANGEGTFPNSSIPREVLCLRQKATSPPPFPSLENDTRRVSISRSSSLAPSLSQASSMSSHSDLQQPSEEDNVGAANLLLMFSKSGSSSGQTRAVAISPTGHSLI